MEPAEGRASDSDCDNAVKGPNEVIDNLVGLTLRKMRLDR